MKEVLYHSLPSDAGELSGVQMETLKEIIDSVIRQAAADEETINVVVLPSRKGVTCIRAMQELLVINIPIGGDYENRELIYCLTRAMEKPQRQLEGVVRNG